MASKIKKLRFLVLDEADRMIEASHFAELDNILRLTLRQSECAISPLHCLFHTHTLFREDQIEPDFGGVSAEDAQDVDAEPATEEEMQTFVFSATLSKDLQRNLKKRARPKGKKRHAPASTLGMWCGSVRKERDTDIVLDDLLMRLDFRDPQPEVIDLSPEGGVVSTLRESRIDCLANEKVRPTARSLLHFLMVLNQDAFLYYFLLRYPGRTLVFLSSIDGIRRLMPLMELLEINAFPLHSQLEQRQRLKNLDRYALHTTLLIPPMANPR